MRKSKQSADFEWDVDANIKARGTVGAAPPKAAPKRIITQAKPVRSRRRDWIWHYCQKCEIRGEWTPPDAIGVPMCSRCVALDTPHPHLHPLLWAAIKLADGIVRRRRRF
jgi:hypothetical protein